MSASPPRNEDDPPSTASEPALHRAARVGDHDAIRSLIASGEPIDALFEIGRVGGARPQPATPLMVAAGSADGATADTVRLLLDLGASIDAGPSGLSALSYACEGLGRNHPSGGDSERVAVLLAAGADPNVAGYNGQSALARAAGSGDPERVRMLLEAGAQPVPEPEQRFSFLWPLYEAVESDSLECVRLLVASGAPLNLAESVRMDPVLTSARSVRVLSELLLAGAEPEAQCLHGKSAAGVIASQRASSIAERVAMLDLLKDAGVDLDRRATTGITALARAAMTGDADAVEALLAAGADPHSEPNALGLVCFSFSADRDAGIERTVDLLIAAGLDPNDVDAGGYTPLHAAVSGDAFGPGYAESDGINVAAAVALLRYGASIDITFPETGYRPLHAAAAGGSAILVEALLAAGADPTERSSAGESPLDVARNADAADCARLLEGASNQ